MGMGENGVVVERTGKEAILYKNKNCIGWSTG
jgi:hypothetical protein